MELHRFGFRLILGLALSMAGASVVSAEVFAGGDGTPASPYQIASAHQWIAFSADPNLWDKHFVLIRDLDMVGVEPNAVDPIGEGGGYCFVGTFDGQGHTIAHLRIVRPKWGLVGAFTQIGGPFFRSESEEELEGHVRNLHLRDVYIHGDSCVGGLVGDFEKGTIRNCSVTGTIRGNDTVGGLVGWAFGSIDSCTAAVEVRGRTKVGGLVGDLSASLSRCASSGRVYGETRVGGLIGDWGGCVHMDGIWESFPRHRRKDISRIVQCRSDCAVYGTDKVGGLIASGIGMGQIEDCYALGPVTGSTTVGGLLSWQVGCCIVRSLAAGPVTGKEEVGALVGKVEPVEDPNSLQDYPLCQAVIEKMPEPDHEGKPQWRLIYRPGILACFCAADTQGTHRPVGLGDDEADVTVLTAGQKGQAATFRERGWGFATVWHMPTGKSYPRLRWESAP